MIGGESVAQLVRSFDADGDLPQPFPKRTARQTAHVVGTLILRLSSPAPRAG